MKTTKPIIQTIADDDEAAVEKLAKKFMSESGYINLDYNDLRRCLTGMGRYAIVSASAAGDDRMSESVAAVAEQLAGIRGIERALMSIATNRNQDPALKTSEIMPLNGLIASFDGTTEILWGIRYDDTLAADALSLTILVSGKGLCSCASDC